MISIIYNSIDSVLTRMTRITRTFWPKLYMKKIYFRILGLEANLNVQEKNISPIEKVLINFILVILVITLTRDTFLSEFLS